MLPEDEDAAAPGHHRKFVVAGRTLTMTQAALIGICVFAVFFAILAAFGVFSGSSPTTPTVVAPPKPLTNTTPHNHQSTTTATTQALEQQLKLGDTGSAGEAPAGGPRDARPPPTIASPTVSTGL